jgi:Kef-type K+ transport system membrane component KefB
MFNLKTMFSFKDISPKTQAHLTQVYTTILACVLFSATGMYLNATFVLQGILWNIASIVSMVYLMYKISSPHLD